ncbi:predicted protein [Naegleria gruberi]|uniref:Predicted protein n=1 Tax=Naegleria gruberi TaxID=5762 RepID=D2W113_NAEGR|nr:uncharacterized protein NAEGRDRAFT_53867 [Naegleria gruberi]EFC37279.1 predicted protein [Naegleria gruberi]|eukprot:XP_002670023.1 predicted protein [Naegleria gruberi strain NEG-M]
MVPNVIINKKYDNQQQMNGMSKLQIEKEEVFAKPEVMNILDDIFNVKLQGKYNNNITEYVAQEEKHSLGEKKQVDVEVKLFDDEDDEELVDKPAIYDENQKEVKIKLFDDIDDDDDVPFKDQLKERQVQKEKSGHKRKRKEKKFSFLEDSDDEDEEHDKSIALNDEDEESDEDEDLLKNKAAETHNFISSTKVKKSEKPNKVAKRHKEQNEWKQIQTLMKEKDEKKKDSSKDSTDL